MPVVLPTSGARPSSGTYLSSRRRQVARECEADEIRDNVMTSVTGALPVHEVHGTIRFADGSPAGGLLVFVAERDLRSEQALGQIATGGDGSYGIQYDASAFADADSGSADLVVRAHAADGSLLAASPVLFNAPASAVVDLIIPAEMLPPPSRFEAVGRALEPLLGRVTVLELEEDAEHQDVS